METIREKRNILCFIISYVINNLASGVLYDTYVNYLQEVQVSIATSFWAFYGYATFISALLLLAVPKIGYKKLLLFCSLGTSFAFFGAIFLQYDWVLYARANPRQEWHEPEQRDPRKRRQHHPDHHSGHHQCGYCRRQQELHHHCQRGQPHLHQLRRDRHRGWCGLRKELKHKCL